MTLEELTAYEERHRAGQRERRRQRRAAGLCVQCGKPAESGRPKCARCLKKDYDREHPPEPPKPEHDPDALTRDVHKLELLNRERQRAGLPALSYGQWRARG
jgi:hypothetical protein